MQDFSLNNRELAASIDELSASTFPLPSHEAAVLNLIEFKDEKILAWLTLLRSLQQGYQHLSSSQVLSSRQIDALSLLKDYPDVLVLQWLRTRRYTGRWWPQRFSESKNLHSHRDGRQFRGFTPGWSFRFPGQRNVHVIFLSTMFFQLDP